MTSVMYEIYFVIYFAVYLFALMSYEWDSIYDNVFLGFFLWILFYGLRSKASKYIPSAPAHEKNTCIDVFDKIFMAKIVLLIIGKSFNEKVIYDP